LGRVRVRDSANALTRSRSLPPRLIAESICQDQAIEGKTVFAHPDVDGVDPDGLYLQERYPAVAPQVAPLPGTGRESDHVDRRIGLIIETNEQRVPVTVGRPSPPPDDVCASLSEVNLEPQFGA
jgi:hypothetical protein